MADAILARGGGGGIKRTIFYDWNHFFFFSGTTNDYTLPDINPDNSIVFFRPNICPETFRPDTSMLGLQIIDGTTLRAESYTGEDDPYYPSGGGHLIEFENAKYKRSGVESVYGTGSLTVGFSQLVNVDKVLVSASMTTRTQLRSNMEGMELMISNLTNNSIEFGFRDYTDKIFYEILELY